MIMRELWAFFSGHASPSGLFSPVFSVLCPPVTPQGTNQPYIVCGFLVLFAKIVFKLCKIRFQLFQWQDLFSLTHRGKIHAGRPLSRIAHTHFKQRSGDSFNFAPESFCTAFRRRSFGASYAILRYGDDAKPNPPFCSAEAHSHICTMLPTLHSNEVLIK